MSSCQSIRLCIKINNNFLNWNIHNIVHQDRNFIHCRNGQKKKKTDTFELLLSLSGLNWTFSIKSKVFFGKHKVKSDALIFPSAQFDKYGLQKKK